MYAASARASRFFFFFPLNNGVEGDVKTPPKKALLHLLFFLMMDIFSLTHKWFDSSPPKKKKIHRTESKLEITVIWS